MIRFIKMHGLGNDFMVIDGIRQNLTLTADTIRQWADRHTGVGFDQCLIVETATQKGVDFNYRIFNANGEEVGQCGNGARCLARFIQFSGLSDKKTIIVGTQTTSMQLTLTQKGEVSVQLSPPAWSPVDIPCQATCEQTKYTIPLDSGNITLHAVSVGNPHAVLIVDDVDKVPVSTLGKQICEHPFFPQQANVGFLQIIREGLLKLRVYERGCGETKACGSGAVAAAVIARRFHQQPQTMTVNLPGGNLTVVHEHPHAPIIMIGDATFVYQGEILL